MKAIVLDHLSKTYPGGKAALREVSIALDPGEIFGFLGPNGAGKTTTVKLLTGMLTPTGGGCTVLGRDPARQPEAVHALAGVVTEHAQMYDTLTGLENLTFFGALFGLDAKASKTRAQALLEALDLTHAAGQKLGAYSTGMRQRLSLARALMHRPQVTLPGRAHLRPGPPECPGRPRPSSPPGPGGGYHLLPVHPPAALCPGNLHLLRPDGPGAALCQGTLDQLRPRWAGAGPFSPGRGRLPFPRPGRGAMRSPLPVRRTSPPWSARQWPPGERSPGSSPRPPRWRTSTSTSSVRERRLCHEPRYACPDPKGPPVGHRQPPDAGDPAGGPPGAHGVPAHGGGGHPPHRPGRRRQTQSSWPSSRWPPGGRAWSGRS